MTTSSPWGQFRNGVIAIWPATFAAIPFALILGAQAIRHGLTAGEILLMSLTVYAGGSQFMAVGIWERPAPWAALAFAVYLINLRHTLMSASIAGKISHFKRPYRIIGIFWLTDEVWAVLERQALTGPITWPFYVGAAALMYVNWAVCTFLGTLIGDLIPQPELFGLDFAFPAIFLCMVMGFATSFRAAPIIGASALAALAAHHWLPGTWYVIVGAFAGMGIAVLIPTRQERA